MVNREVVSDKQGIAIMILFLTGSTSIFVTGLDAKKDLWIAIILAIFMVLPMIMIFARLHYIFPGKDLFDIFEICFGKFVGRIMMIVFTWYTFYWTADVLNNYAFFIRTVNLWETPKIIFIIILGILCAWGIKEGIEVLGRWAELFLIIVIIGIWVALSLLIPNMNFHNMQPVLYNGFKPVLKGAYSVFTQPFVQTVAFTMAFTYLKRKKSSYKVYIIGLFIGSILTFMISVTNILVIGIDEATRVYYPSYVTVARVDIRDFIQRLEVIIAIVFILGGFIKISILLLCTCKGMTKIFGCKDYRLMIIPITLMIMNIAYFQYDSVQHYFQFNTEIWASYFFPFQVILPIITWIIAETKKYR
ncbi:GerAB/ArcD/ProY family transporter [Crassaminicella thermophila]|uniref:GerAB/ArcD/ProY family transporter n=1 Tax=Crassaminicella thermophila TaxID=2599308 RepID=A0A5C0SK08_CRATE|nr:endospore germination permease [Crassaminicella thermophila]QEK13518.1 GerAB/ArcD/ProY family transporter [Crassaminicella thermophila]